ncbi:hypothetical protein XA68_15876 [Ophiocordyceps unilateralis]|uniref:Pre-mRNA-splicing factor n=1 Tax=Ophiocordyceps unilateralis TaxID=268505 RepID=A0A2A9PT21_OPHUN|nr:hypothetical protein XA68_15876 [Ophiocordyceps unilateralis]
MTDQDKGRIAIKFGGASSSSKQSAIRPSAPPSRLGKRPRQGAFATGHDSDSDRDEAPVRHEAITGFGADGAETTAPRSVSKRHLVIARQPNRDWRAELRAQRRGRIPLPAEEETRRAQAVERDPADDDKHVQWGLTVRSKSAVEDDDEDDTRSEDLPTARNNNNANDDDTQPRERTADDAALDALLDRTSHPPKAIILDEDAAYRRDAAAAGAPSTLDDYEAMPVDDFGAALLRGMGWNGESRGPKVKEVGRRANRLGLGAKELKETEDLGGWGQASASAKKKRPRLDEYRREESRRKDGRRHEDSYKGERDRERDGYRDRVRDGNSERERRGHRYRDHDRDRRR